MSMALPINFKGGWDIFVHIRIFIKHSDFDASVDFYGLDSQMAALISRFPFLMGSKVLNLVLHLRMLPCEMGAKRNPETEGPMPDEQTLLQEMAKAIEGEDYNRAAELRDALQELHENDKALVFSANARFYHNFRNGDLAGMRSIWALEDSVYVVHPGAGRICGYDLVMDSWEILCGADREFPIQIELRDVEVGVSGNVGYVSCVEVVKAKGGSWGKQIATNVFKKMHGQWFLCVHHASHIDD